MQCSSLHHIELCVKDLIETTRLFTQKLGFNVIATRETKTCIQNVVKQNNSLFVITERKVANNSVNGGVSFKFFEHWTVFCCRDTNQHLIDSVFNSAIGVKNVAKLTAKVETKGGQVIIPPTKVSDDWGEVEYSIVGTPIGNAVHTLINKTNYKGSFLPGFDCVDRKYDFVATDSLCTHIDHVAYICEEGQTSGILKWYEDVFGMKRFLLNQNEDDEEGFVLRDNVGLRLKALEYWHCSETGLYSDPSEGCNTDDAIACFYIVIGEPITEIEGNHVSLFLKHHRGPGIQHIALHSSSILQTVQMLDRRGIHFRKPPPAYYIEGGKLEEMKSVGLEAIADGLQEAGLLLDTEACPDSQQTDNAEYLLQIFTKPIFKEPTFFLEVLHRAGATGFGQGNITALARSIEHQNRMDVKHLTETSGISRCK